MCLKTWYIVLIFTWEFDNNYANDITLIHYSTWMTLRYRNDTINSSLIWLANANESKPIIFLNLLILLTFQTVGRLYHFYTIVHCKAKLVYFIPGTYMTYKIWRKCGVINQPKQFYSWHVHIIPSFHYLSRWIMFEEEII